MLKRTREHTSFHKGRSGNARRIALSYTIFLLICLALILTLYLTSTGNARHNFWQHQATSLVSAIDNMTRDLSIMKNYSTQLLTDSTFVRFTNMEASKANGFYYTAYEVKLFLANRMYGLMNLPIRESHIYLRNTGYVISASQFSEVEQYFRAYRHFLREGYEIWIDMLDSATSLPACYSMEPFTGQADGSFLILDLNSLPTLSVPATIWFELDLESLRSLFLPAEADSALILIDNAQGERQLTLGKGDYAGVKVNATALAESSDQEGSTPPDSKNLIAAMENAEWDPFSMASYGSMQLIRRTGENGWVYTLALPASLCSEALGNYDLPFFLIFLTAVLLGVLMIAYLVKLNMRPLHQLSNQLIQVQDDNAELQKEIDAQRPVLCASYLRTLVSGHVASNEEFDYIMRFLGIQGECQYFVLFCSVHHQDSSLAWNDAEEHRLLYDSFDHYLDTGYPLYLYTTLAREYVVLMTYDRSFADPLMDMQRRVITMHDALLDQHSLWFYAGVGDACTQANRLWESYEQARAAARYTGRSHIFLPYKFILKDPDSWYYPVELSAKLQHFITTSNKQQVGEFFALIHRENMDDRHLSAPLLNYLLSDLKNTLLKVRFQVPPPQTEEAHARLTQLDQSLAEPLRFPQLESNALLLCDFFTSSAEPSDPIPEIVRYLQDNFADPSMCLSKLSGMFNISESYLSHLFKDKTGQNFSVYLEELRMNEAARRLSTRTCNLTNLYVDLGYTNPTTFRRVFKKHFGMTPSEMRQKKAEA